MKKLIITLTIDADSVDIGGVYEVTDIMHKVAEEYGASLGNGVSDLYNTDGNKVGKIEIMEQ